MHVKLLGESLSLLSLVRWCDELVYFYFWQPGGPSSTLTQGKKTITCCTDTFVPLVAVTQQKVAPSVQARPGHTEILIKRTPLAEKKAWRETHAATRTPAVVTDEEGTLTLERKRPAWDKESQRFQTKE